MEGLRTDLACEVDRSTAERPAGGLGAFNARCPLERTQRGGWPQEAVDLAGGGPISLTPGYIIQALMYLRLGFTVGKLNIADV
jgi:hypothetical protein